MADESEPNIVVTDVPEAADTAVIADGLRAYNTSRAGYDDYQPLAVFVTDPASGKVLGGLMAAAISASCGSAASFCPRGCAVGGSAAAFWPWRRRRRRGGGAVACA